jgi:hypothetical protein
MGITPESSLGAVNDLLALWGAIQSEVLLGTLGINQVLELVGEIANRGITGNTFQVNVGTQSYPRGSFTDYGLGDDAIGEVEIAQAMVTGLTGIFLYLPGIAEGRIGFADCVEELGHPLANVLIVGADLGQCKYVRGLG